MSSFAQLKAKRDARNAVSLACSADEKSQHHHKQAPKRVSDNASSSSASPSSAKQEKKGHALSSRQGRLEANPDLHVKEADGKGRGLFWDPTDGRRMGRGTTLLRLQPEVVVPSSENLEGVCHKCFSASEGGKALQRCSGCKVLRYCSVSCQTTDWPAHRQECKALQQFCKSQKASEAPNTSNLRDPGMSIRLLGRLVWERRRLGSAWWKRIEDLQSNRAAITSDQSLVDMPLRLAHYLGIEQGQTGKERMTELGFTNPGDLLDLISRSTINSFVAYSSDLTALGIALSSSAAMTNHSCTPTVAVVYPNGPGVKDPMHVVALKDLEPGDELTTFYVDVSDPYDLRQRALETRYSFKCTCSLCLKSERSGEGAGKKAKVDAREAIWCGRAGCSGWVAAPREKQDGQARRCTKCKLESEVDVNEVLAALQAGVETLEKVDQMMGQNNMNGALECAQSTVRMLTQLQPPSSYPLLSLLRQLQTALILVATTSSDQQRCTECFEEAIRFHLLSLAGMQASNGAVFCEGHPSRAIALATLATLLVREVTNEECVWIARATSPFLSRAPAIPPPGPARDQAGMSLMVQAIKELKIAYGHAEDGGQPGRKLIDQVREWKADEVMSRLPGASLSAT